MCFCYTFFELRRKFRKKVSAYNRCLFQLRIKKALNKWNFNFNRLNTYILHFFKSQITVYFEHYANVEWQWVGCSRKGLMKWNKSREQELVGQHIFSDFFDNKYINKWITSKGSTRWTFIVNWPGNLSSSARNSFDSETRIDYTEILKLYRKFISW